MSLAEFKTLVSDAPDTVIELLHDHDGVMNIVKRQVVELVEVPSIIPRGSDFPLVQVSDASFNFNTPERGKYTENPYGFIDVHCYNYARTDKAGANLRGYGKNQGIYKLIGEVLDAVHGKVLNNFYWIIVASISQAVPILLVDQSLEDAETVYLKTVVFEIRRRMTLV